MKDIIVMLAGIILAVYIFSCIAGDENSIRSSLKVIWEKEIPGRQYVLMVDEK